MTTTHPARAPLRGIRHTPRGIGALVALSLAAAAGGFLAVRLVLAHEPPQLSPFAESDLLPHGTAGDHRVVFAEDVEALDDERVPTAGPDRRAALSQMTRG
jgi:hypothetical protein